MVDKHLSSKQSIIVILRLCLWMFQLKQWKSSGDRLTTPMIDTIVAACSRREDANRAFETFEMYEQLGLKHRTESYNSLMEVCAKQKQIEVIMKLLQEMSNENVKPNVDTYMQVNTDRQYPFAHFPNDCGVISLHGNVFDSMSHICCHACLQHPDVGVG